MRHLLPLLMLLTVSLAAAQTAPVLTMDFEKGFDAQSPAGVVKATVDGKPELVPGKFGQALKSGPGTGYLNFPTNLLKSTAGTVEMWVCPVDWRPADREFHAFFDLRGEGALYLYKYVDGTNLLMLSCANGGGPYFSSAFALNWKPGEWHHIAGTWSASGVRSYVDGKPAGAMPVEAQLPAKLGDSFLIGDHPWHLPRTTSSLIDEVRVYDRALSPAHIAAHAAGKLDFAAPLDAKTAFLKYDLEPENHQARVLVSTGGADVPDNGLAAKIAIVDKGAAMPADTPATPFAGGQVIKSVPVEAKVGKYEVVAEVLQAGKPVFVLRRDLEIPDTTTWLGNKLGTEDKVLPPWTPVKVTGQKVSVWDREYDFRPLSTDYDMDQDGLIGQIHSGGAALLAAPVRLYLFAGGNPVVMNATPVATDSPTQTQAVLRRTLRPTIEDNIRVSATVAYDGLAIFELSGNIPEGCDTLTLDIPLRPEIALYRHRYSSAWDTGKVTGNLPAGDGVIDHDKFIPYYWLGNNDRGLFWMCESDEGWPNSDDANAVQVVREKGQVILRLNLLAKGQKLPDTWKFTFALQATPVKPLPADWRKWRLQPGRNANVSIMWPTPQKDSVRFFGYPEATDPQLMTERIKALHKQGVSAVPYLCLSYLSAACPEWPFFSKKWGMGSVDATSSDVAQYGAGFAMASPVGKGYADFIVWKTAQFIKQFGIGGLYHDNTHPYSSTNLDAGCGYVRNGKVRPTFPILGFRDLYRRMYAVMKAARPDGFTMAHMSGKVTIPILAYDDSYLDGEHFRSVVKDSYLDVLSLDTFRAEFMGRQWGIIPCFLPEFDAEHAAQVEPTRGLMALLMLHDVTPWPIWCNKDVVNEALSDLDAFGYTEAKFIGYFETTPPATTDMKDVYVSAYQRKDGGLLLIVSNVGKEDRQGTVSINAQRLGLSVKEVVDWPGQQPIAASGSKVALTVPRRGYRMLVVRR